MSTHSIYSAYVQSPDSSLGWYLHEQMASRNVPSVGQCEDSKLGSVSIVIGPELFEHLRRSGEGEAELKQQRHFKRVIDLVEERYLELGQALTPPNHLLPTQLRLRDNSQINILLNSTRITSSNSSFRPESGCQEKLAYSILAQ